VAAPHAPALNRGYQNDRSAGTAEKAASFLVPPGSFDLPALSGEPRTHKRSSEQHRRQWKIVARKTWEDKITLANVKIMPHLGTTPEERNTPQECVADLTVWADLAGAAATDSLDKSIDYCHVLETVQRTAEAQPYNLVETLAYRIVRSVLQDFPVSRARIKLRKCPASLLGAIDFVEVEVEET
jgi:dihydroneopterin aldolase